MCTVDTRDAPDGRRANPTYAFIASLYASRILRANEKPDGRDYSALRARLQLRMIFCGEEEEGGSCGRSKEGIKQLDGIFNDRNRSAALAIIIQKNSFTFVLSLYLLLC